VIHIEVTGNDEKRDPFIGDINISITYRVGVFLQVGRFIFDSLPENDGKFEDRKLYQRFHL